MTEPTQSLRFTQAELRALHIAVWRLPQAWEAPLSVPVPDVEVQDTIHQKIRAALADGEAGGSDPCTRGSHPMRGAS